MFENILAHFSDFPQKEILFYAPVQTFDETTGKDVDGFEYDYAIMAFGFQKGAMKNILHEKVWDAIDFVLIFGKEYTPPQENIVYFDEQWYKIMFPDNVGLADSVCVMGAKRINKPNIVSGTPSDYTVLGDAGGIL